MRAPITAATPDGNEIPPYSVSGIAPYEGRRL